MNVLIRIQNCVGGHLDDGEDGLVTFWCYLDRL
jgi:hypothetical protein